METSVKQIEEEITPLDLSIHSHRNVKITSTCLPIQKTRVFDQENETAMDMKKIDDIDHMYSSITRYMLLDTVKYSGIPHRIQFFLKEKACVDLTELTDMMEILLSHFFYRDFRKIIYSGKEKLTESSEIECAEILLSWSVTICVERTYFNFMLVATFLNYVLQLFFVEFKCFRILYIIEFCFDVLYRRIFWQFFKSHENYGILFSFCFQFNDHMEPERTASKLAAFFSKVNWIHHVTENINATGEGFSLTESEKELFKKFYSIECAADMSNELDKDLIDCLVSEDPNFLFHRVSSCGTKCYSYLNYANQFPWE
ncbi:hypothetical protein NPIL_197411 [Nephila pilipes]|uniref:Uncharacterized protein n=1 Tax=Nephila pilipes TaxID=299642 RepID=A0A8X6UNG0_NEPPI|nr:hypothetical protein NPIL_197411 [Nephila pilipes]